MSTYTTLIGIDVSLATLDICNLSADSKEVFKQIKNNSKSIVDWLSQLPADQVLCVLEPTGCYSSRLLYYLQRYGIATCVVNPNQSNGFTQAQGITSKNDRQAAKTLALMGKSLDLPLYQHSSDDMKRRKQLLSGINALKKQRQMLRNQLHALDHQIIFAPKVVDALKQTLQTVEEQLEQLNEELNELSDEEHQQQFELMTSVVGVGPKIAHLLLVSTGGIHHFEHARQLSKFIGVVPYSHKSGSSVRKKGRITKRGNRDLRAALFMGARSATQYNAACKDLYLRLREAGKPYKQAMVAVMNKLIKQIFGVVNSGVSFDNQFYLKTKVN